MIVIHNKNKGGTMLKKLLVMLLAITLAACTTMQPIILQPQNIQNSVQVGDRVQVETIQGQRLQFRVAQTTPKALIGVNQLVVPYSQIRTLHKIQVSESKTFAGAGLLYVIGTVAAVALAASAV